MTVEKTYLIILAVVLVNGNAYVVGATSRILVADNATVRSIFNKITIFPLTILEFKKLAEHDIASKGSSGSCA